jgi:hypothetical protein
MRKSNLEKLGAAACLLVVTTGTVMAESHRSYDECHQLAVARGLSKPSLAAGDRYNRLKAAGQKTHPQGFIARCMAGIQE